MAFSYTASKGNLMVNFYVHFVDTWRSGWSAFSRVKNWSQLWSVDFKWWISNATMNQYDYQTKYTSFLTLNLLTIPQKLHKLNIHSIWKIVPNFQVRIYSQLVTCRDLCDGQSTSEFSAKRLCCSAGWRCLHQSTSSPRHLTRPQVSYLIM